MKTSTLCMLTVLVCLFLANCTIERPTVKMESYYPSVGVDAAQWITSSYIDDHLTRQEIHYTSAASDSYLNFQRRISRDNGRTWEEFIPIERVTNQLAGGGFVTFPGPYTYDPTLDILYQLVMRRQFPGKRLYDFEVLDYVDHTIVLENGKAVEMKYEAGPGFSTAAPFDSTYLRTNRAYFGQRITVGEDGTAYLPIVCFRKEHEIGINQGGIVLMRRDPTTGLWSASNQQYISPNLSSRGLLEPEATILKNGNILVVCRGSNAKGLKHVTHPDSLQARKWYLLSKDGGKTLGPVKELKYQDGSRFFSPSSIHSFMRSSKNGKLYWVANIPEAEPNGNWPRYPLCMGEINEEIPALIKESIITIDDKRTGDAEKLQLSNFSLLENRETQDFEILITKIGQVAEHPKQGSVFKYTIEIPR